VQPVVEIQKASCTVVVDWNDFEDDNLTGMTAVFYPKSSDSQPILKRVNIGSSKVVNIDFLLPPGDYDVLVFNQTESEFANLSFSGMTQFSQARVFVADEKSGDQVDWFAVASMPDFQVTEKMAKSTTPTVINFKPVTIVKPLSVKLRIHGIQNLLSQFDCSISGLSSGYYLSTGQSFSSTVSHNLSDWKIKFTNQEKTSAVDSTTIRTFGFPSDKSFNLSLSFYLRDMSTTSAFKYEKVSGNGYISLEDNSLNVNIGFLSDEYQESSDNADPGKIILLPDVEAPVTESNGGFKVTLEDWGPAEDIDVKIE